MKSILPLLLVAGLILAGCGGKKEAQEQRGAPRGETSTEAPERAAQPPGGTSRAPQYPPVPGAGATKTASGLTMEDLVVGNGAVAETGKMVSVHYAGWLQDSTKFDASYDRGKPFEFQLGQGQVIKGWEEGVTGMKVDGKRLLIIPPELGYGERGAGGRIPPNATLTFQVELLEVK